MRYISYGLQLVMTRLKTLFLCLSILAIGLYSAIPTFGQSARDEFNPNVSGPVRAFAFQADGKILIGGSFTSVAGAAHTNIARLYPDGRVDNTFNLAAINDNCPICSIVVGFAAQGDGKTLVAGGFRTLGGQPRPGLARLNADGSLDPAFT